MRVAVVAAVLLWGVRAAAQNGSVELEFPTYPLSPPVVAVGGAGVAWSHDAAASLNPATLFGAPRISVHHFEGFADYAGNLAAGSVLVLRRFAIGISLRRFGWDRIIEDDLGVPVDGLNTGHAQYGLTIAASPTRSIKVGVAASRLVTDNLGVRIAGTSWSFGTMLIYSNTGHVGVALLHTGPAIRGGSGDRYALPTRVRAGVRQQVANGVSLVVEGALPPKDGSAWTAHAGAEWRAPSILTLRGGVESSAGPGTERSTRFAGGIGLAVGRLEVSLTTRLGGPDHAQEWFVGLDALRPRSQ